MLRVSTVMARGKRRLKESRRLVGENSAIDFSFFGYMIQVETFEIFFLRATLATENIIIPLFIRNELRICDYIFIENLNAHRM